MDGTRDQRWKLRYQWETRGREIAIQSGGDIVFKDNISELDQR